MTATKEMIGRKFGMLTVIKRIPSRIQPSGRKRVMWLCQCDCGNTKEASGACLRNGTTISCGCVRRKPNTKPKHESTPRDGSYKDNLIGQKFGMLTIIGEGEPYVSPGGAKYRTCRCRCDCGNIKDVRLSRLKLNKTYSCGCVRRTSHEYQKTLAAPHKPKDPQDVPAHRASAVVDIQHELTVGRTYRFGNYDYILIRKFPHHGLFLDPFEHHECFDWWTVQKTIRYGGMPDTFRFWMRYK